MIKKIILAVTFITTIISVVFLYASSNDNRQVLVNKKNESNINTNALTMMYETASDSGEYQVSSDTSWPQEGYIFNSRLSGLSPNQHSATNS